MAIDISLYPNKVKQNLWADQNFYLFYYNFKIKDKRFRGRIDLSKNSGASKRDRLLKAESELMDIREKAISSLEKEQKEQNDLYHDEMTLNAYMDGFWKRWKLEPTREKNYKSFYDRYIKGRIGKKPIKDILPIDVKDVIASVGEAGNSPRRQKDVLNILKPMFNEAIENRIIIYNPTDSVKVKLPSTKKIVNEASEKLSQINEAIELEFGDNPFHHAFFLFALQGRRKGEILTLKWEDVNLNKDFYIIRDVKNGEDQKMFLPPKIKELLLEFKDESWTYVFENQKTKTHIQDVKRQVAKLKKRLQNNKFASHFLRNVISSAMAEEGLESIYLSGALGHKDPNTIKKYLSLNYLQSSKKASEVISKITS
jgi:integrase